MVRCQSFSSSQSGKGFSQVDNNMNKSPFIHFLGNFKASKPMNYDASGESIITQNYLENFAKHNQASPNESPSKPQMKQIGALKQYTNGVITIKNEEREAIIRKEKDMS